MGRSPKVRKSHNVGTELRCYRAGPVIFSGRYTYTERFMLRLDEPSQTKLQQLIKQFGASKAELIRQLIAQAKPEDFPKGWHRRH